MCSVSGIELPLATAMRSPASGHGLVLMPDKKMLPAKLPFNLSDRLRNGFEGTSRPILRLETSLSPGRPSYSDQFWSMPRRDDDV